MCKNRLGILISGRGSNMEAIIQACSQGILNATVACVISNNPSAKGIAIAKKNGVDSRVVNPSSFESFAHYEHAIITLLKEKQVEWVCLAGYMRLVKHSLLSAYKDKIINIHPSLLPSFKGLHPQKQALEYGVTVSGCSVHFVNEEIDGGAIIMQKAVPVLPNDSIETLSDRILKEEHILYVQAIQHVIKKRSKEEELI